MDLERLTGSGEALITRELRQDRGAAHLSLVERSSAEVHRFVGQRVANHADAADLAQEALLLACGKLSTFRGENFRAWLFTIARHLIVDHYRVQHRHEFVDVTPAGVAETQHALQTDPEAVQLICENRDRVRCWVECISHWLRLEEQVAVLLADLHGYSDSDSAAALNLSLPSFKLLLHQARGRLRQVSGGACTLAQPTRGAANTTVAIRTKPGRIRGRNDSMAAANEPAKINDVAPTPQVCACPLRDNCRPGEICRLGIKCCRRVPKLLALRSQLLDVLLEALGGGSLLQLLLLLNLDLDSCSVLFETVEVMEDFVALLF